MLDNIIAIENAHALVRARRREYETRTIDNAEFEAALVQGWVEHKRNQNSVRVKRLKPHDKLLEDRVWCLFHAMGFSYLSGEGGAHLTVNQGADSEATNQIDVAVIDQEVAIAVECKSQEALSKRGNFQQELGKFNLIRNRFTAAVRSKQFEERKRTTALVMFLWNAVLSSNDLARAEDANIIILDNHDLEYYETLVSHVGSAARYQFLADILPGKTIPELEIRVPAVKSRMGGANCYTFPISPEYLLKIAYISHRSKGRGSDINAYQRMLKRSRLKKIREYLDEDGIFPTNIVINLDKNRVDFQRVKQDADKEDKDESGVLGWLDIRPAYKSAWVIDGQHRLFAYSGYGEAKKARLSVLAFEGLRPSMQAKLFIDINAQQKRVKQSLLQELFAELHWDSDEPDKVVRAIVSKALQTLSDMPDAALFRRIQTADAEKDDIRCVTFESLYGAIERGRFHIVDERRGHVRIFGPLWAENRERTLQRTVFVLGRWLDSIRDAVPDWWNIGRGEGGGIAMNDGITAVIGVLQSVFRHVEKQGVQCVVLEDHVVFEKIEPYALALGEYLRGLSIEERKAFRDLRGVQGQTTRRRRCEKGINERMSEFRPDELAEFLESERRQTNSRAKTILDGIEIRMQQCVVTELKAEFGQEEKDWWMRGVPQKVRRPVRDKFEQDKGARGGLEYYFDLIDYRDIVTDNWELFEDIFGADSKGSKDKRTDWISFLNEKRRIVAHPSAGATVSVQDLGRLEEIENWFNARLVQQENVEASESTTDGPDAEDE